MTARVMMVAAAGLLALSACGKSGKSAEQVTEREQAKPEVQTAAADAAGQLTPAERSARTAAGRVDDDAPYYTALPLSEFMPHVMQYAGDGIWKRQGYVVDAKGEHSLFPKNEEEWEEAESAARTLAEVTNVLLIPGRRVPEADWDKAVLAVRKVALQAADAAEKKNEDAWFEAGGALDEACDVCHAKYDPKFKPQ